MKKIFAILMIVMMVVCFMPTAAFGADDGMSPGDISAVKTVSGPDENGNYTIHLSVQGKNVVETTGSNADVVLVVDNSGSMSSSVGIPCTTRKSEFIQSDPYSYWIFFTRKDYSCEKCGATYYEILDLKGETLYTDVPEICTGEVGKTVRINAAKEVSKEFAQGILKDKNSNKMALIGFSHGDKDGGANDSKAIKVNVGLTDNRDALNEAIEKMEANGGTNYSAALEAAYNILNSRTDKNRPGYVVFISDGAPGYSGESLKDPKWNGSEQIDKLKKAGITVFTVGIALEDGPADYLKGMATEPEQEHFINVKGTDYAKQLSDILKLWAEQINSKPAGTEAVMVDIVNLEKFEVIDCSNGIEKEENSTGKYIWNIGDITETSQTQTITVKPLVSGTNIPTNKDVNLKYKDPEGASKTIDKEKIGDPTVDVAKVTFKVVNGTWDGTDAKDRTVLVPLSVTESKGTLKSAPTGMVANAGYESGSWDTEPDTTENGITGDVTYTYTFTERVPVETTAIVTFKVVNGTWKDGTTADIQKTIILKDGKGTLVATDVPNLMKANAGYEGGSWDTDPNTTTNGITGDVTYTYTFTERVPVETTATVTFKVVNGTWKDGATADIKKTITLKDGKGTLAATDVPDLMKANAGYEGGAWDKTPNTEIDGITGDVTYTYTFTKKEQPPIPPTHYYTVKWNNYDNTNLETDYCTYYQMPTYDSATPVRPADEKYTYEFIGWDKEVVRVTGDAVYTAQFKAVAKEQPKPEDPADPTNPDKPGRPDKPAKPNKPEKPAKPDKPDTEVPKTGDTSVDNMIINLFLLTSSALAAALLWYRKYARK